MKKLLKKGFLLSAIAICIFSITVSADVVPVKLDSYYDDWVDKPSQILKYGWEQAGQYHTVKWYIDSTDLYLYIQMGKKGGQNLGNYQIDYTVNGGSQKAFQLSPDQPKTGRVTIWDYSRGARTVSNDGYVTRGSNRDGLTSDQAEFRIPLSNFGSGVTNQNISISLTFPNLGSQTVQIVGAGTLPWLGIALCIFFVIAALFLFRFLNMRKKT